MPWASVRLKPGLDVEETPTYDSAAYNETQFGRFKAGLFQKLGGWTKYYPFAMNGTGKALHAWQDLNSNKYLAVGTTARLSVINNGNIKDVSPQYLDSDFNPDFTTTLGDATVEIDDPNIANVTTDDSVFFRTPVSVGGLILSGLYPIATRTGTTTYTIEARGLATATRTNLAITGITKANPGVVTYSGADNIADGDIIYIYGVSGMTEVNGRTFTVAGLNTGANTFQLSGVNTTSYTTYTSGGFISFGVVPRFTATSGESEIDVLLPDHAQVEGNTVVFQIPTTVGGVVVTGKYGVTDVTGVDTFTISVNSAASSTETVSMNTGKAGITYRIAIGPSGAGTGYGLGEYGEGPYGIGGEPGVAQTGIPLPATDWSLDNWGEILLANPQDGGIYYWTPTSGYQNASIISSAPAFNAGMFVSMAQQQIIAFGSSLDAWDASTQASGVSGIGTYQDPLLVQWSDSGDFFEWEATASTQAGNFRIPTGSEIIGGLATQNRNLIWTDLDLWGMGYVGSQFVYSFNKIGSNCGLIGPHARAQFGNAVYWMSSSNFFFYAGGGVQPIPCSVYDDVFQDLDLANGHKCVAGSNTDFTEVWFFYPSITGGTGEPDKYAKVNLVENTWDTGLISRSAWIDRSILGGPIAIGSDNSIIYSHEDGYDADDLPLTPSFTTGYFYLDEGETFSFIDQMYPDFKFGTASGSQNAQIQLSINSVETPGETPTVHGPFLVTQGTMYVDCRVRARQISLTVSSSDIGSFWRLGLVRFRFSSDGRR